MIKLWILFVLLAAAKDTSESDSRPSPLLLSLAKNETLPEQVRISAPSSMGLVSFMQTADGTNYMLRPYAYGGRSSIGRSGTNFYRGTSNNRQQSYYPYTISRSNYNTARNTATRVINSNIINNNNNNNLLSTAYQLSRLRSNIPTYTNSYGSTLFPTTATVSDPTGSFLLNLPFFGRRRLQEDQSKQIEKSEEIVKPESFWNMKGGQPEVIVILQNSGTSSTTATPVNPTLFQLRLGVPRAFQLSHNSGTAGVWAVDRSRTSNSLTVTDPAPVTSSTISTYPMLGVGVTGVSVARNTGSMGGFKRFQFSVTSSALGEQKACLMFVDPSTGTTTHHYLHLVTAA